MNRHLKCFILVTVVWGFFLFSPNPLAQAAEPSLSTYTSTPVFLSQSVPPNIFIILDNSGSMNFNAYGSYPGDGGLVPEPYLGGPICNIKEVTPLQDQDDAEENKSDGYAWYNSYDLDMGGYGSEDTWIGIRFQNVNLPRGVTITSAYIQFTGRRSSDHTGEVTNLNIYGEASDNASAFQSNYYNISSRPRTAALVQWTNIPDWSDNQRNASTRTPDISAVIQAIVNRGPSGGNPGWESGNSLVIILEGPGKRDVQDYDSGDAGDNPVLHLEYTPSDCVRYYGYFDPDAKYTYSSNKFSRDPAGQWDGNWLNWLCMRRIDVARKVMMGGLATARTGGGNQTLYGETPAQSSRTFVKRYNGSGMSPYSGNYYYGMSGGYIYVDDDSNPFSGQIARYNIAIQKDQANEPQDFYQGNLAGVLQRVGDKAYWGNEWFYEGTGTNREGGFVANPIGTNMNTLITDLQNTGADTWTPLAEAFYVATQYFKQEAPQSGLGYSNSATGPFNNVRDPYYRNSQFIECPKSFVILLTDGASTKDSKIPAALKDYDADGNDNTSCNESTGSNCDYADGGTDYLDDVALYARTTDLRSDLAGDQNIILYPIYAFGDDPDARELLRDAAKNGGFDDRNGNNRPDLQVEWDEDGDGVPDTYFEATDGYQLEAQLMAAITDILKRASSGTAVSVLATSSEGEGTLVQAYFKPSVPVGLEEVNWVGYLHSLWVDSQGRIREDTPPQGSRPGLVLSHDKIIEFFFDQATGEASFKRFQLDANGDQAFVDANGNGLKDEGESYIYTTHVLDDLQPIWEAGALLQQRDASTRTIKTFVDLDNDGQVTVNPDPALNEFIEFNTDKAASIKPFLGVKDNTAWSYLGAAQNDRINNLIKYIRGDASGYTGSPNLRSRVIDGQVWKMGDIIHSTPLSFGQPMDNFGLIYGDQSYQEYYALYRERETMVYVGGNDGMLHAYYMGKYTVGDDEDTAETEQIYFESTGPGIGQELWAFIPQALLPHLKWLPYQDYPHVYYVDLKPKVVDAKIFSDDAVHPNGWGSVLIGGLNMGGKEISVTDDFPEGTNATRTFTSCYFAIDVTDPHNPVLLWERTYPSIGLTTSMPAVAKVDDSWFAVFGSGPTDYDGTSNQRAHIYVVDLATGQLRRDFNTGTNNSFMATPATVDVGLNYNVDVGYIGLSYGNWAGEMYRFRVPKLAGDWRNAAASDVYDEDPTNWEFSLMFEADGPITAAGSASIDSTGNLWLYFGTGRYLSEADKVDTSTQYFYGIKDPYYNRAMYETQIAAAGKNPSHFDLLDATSVNVYTDGTIDGATPGSVDTWGELLELMDGRDGWVLSLGTEAENIGERVLNKPTVLGGIVFDTTFVPNDDPCGYSGNSNALGLYYETGTAYVEEVFSGGGTTVTVGGETKTRVERKTEVGFGRGSGISIHVGRQEGATGYVQQSTGTIEALQLNPAFNVRSGFIYWRER